MVFETEAWMGPIPLKHPLLQFKFSMSTFSSNNSEMELTSDLWISQGFRMQRGMWLVQPGHMTQFQTFDWLLHVNIYESVLGHEGARWIMH